MLRQGQRNVNMPLLTFPKTTNKEILKKMLRVNWDPLVAIPTTVFGDNILYVLVKKPNGKVGLVEYKEIRNIHPVLTKFLAAGATINNVAVTTKSVISRKLVDGVVLVVEKGDIVVDDKVRITGPTIKRIANVVAKYDRASDLVNNLYATPLPNHNVLTSDQVINFVRAHFREVVNDIKKKKWRSITPEAYMAFALGIINIFMNPEEALEVGSDGTLRAYGVRLSELRDIIELDAPPYGIYRVLEYHTRGIFTNKYVKDDIKWIIERYTDSSHANYFVTAETSEQLITVLLIHALKTAKSVTIRNNKVVVEPSKPGKWILGELGCKEEGKEVVCDPDTVIDRVVDIYEELLSSKYRYPNLRYYLYYRYALANGLLQKSDDRYIVSSKALDPEELPISIAGILSWLDLIGELFAVNVFSALHAIYDRNVRTEPVLESDTVRAGRIVRVVKANWYDKDFYLIRYRGEDEDSVVVLSRKPIHKAKLEDILDDVIIKDEFGDYTPRESHTNICPERIGSEDDIICDDRLLVENVPAFRKAIDYAHDMQAYDYWMSKYIYFRILANLRVTDATLKLLEHGKEYAEDIIDMLTCMRAGTNYECEEAGIKKYSPFIETFMALEHRHKGTTISPDTNVKIDYGSLTKDELIKLLATGIVLGQSVLFSYSGGKVSFIINAADQISLPFIREAENYCKIEEHRIVCDVSVLHKLVIGVKKYEWEKATKEEVMKLIDLMSDRLVHADILKELVESAYTGKKVTINEDLLKIMEKELNVLYDIGVITGINDIKHLANAILYIRSLAL